MFQNSPASLEHLHSSSAQPVYLHMLFIGEVPDLVVSTAHEWSLTEMWNLSCIHSSSCPKELQDSSMCCRASLQTNGLQQHTTDWTCCCLTAFVCVHPHLLTCRSRLQPQQVSHGVFGVCLFHTSQCTLDKNLNMAAQCCTTCNNTHHS